MARRASPEADDRAALVAAARHLVAAGLTHGTSGNLSVRCREGFLVTPSGIPPARLEPAMIAWMALASEGEAEGPFRPSTEWRFHRDILRARPEVNAIVHAHAPHCTALAVARRAIPACHYMIAAFGGPTIRCGGYARFGTAALSAEAVRALEDRAACLLANHGMIAVGPTLDRALWLAAELEALARLYIAALAVPGGPVILSDAEVAEAVEAFQDYGPRGRTGSADRP